MELWSHVSWYPNCLSSCIRTGPMIVVEGMVFDWAPSTPSPAVADAILRELRIKRLYSRAVYWLKKQEIRPTPEVFQAKLAALAAEFSYADIDSTPDAIYEEAISIASDLIVKTLARDNLPPPRNLRDHAEQLVTQHPQLLEQAKTRIETQSALVRESIATAQAVDIEAL